MYTFLYRFKLQIKTTFACIKAKGVYNCFSVYVYICLREKLHIFVSFDLRNKKKCFSIMIVLEFVNEQTEYLISQLLSGRRKKPGEKGTV